MLSKSKMNEIYVLQKQCIRIISNVRGNTLTEPLFQNLKIVKFSDMIRIELCKYGFKIANRLIPRLVQLLMENKGGLKQHRYETRNKNTPNMHRHTSEHYYKRFTCQSIKEYNRLSLNLPK